MNNKGMWYDGRWMTAARASGYAQINTDTLRGRKGRAVQIHGTDFENWDQEIWDQIFSKEVRVNQSVEAEVKQLRLKSIALQKYCDDLAGRLNRIEPHKVEEYLISVEARVRELNSRLKASIHKETVSTEMLYLLKNRDPEKIPVIMTALVKAYDKGDDWWNKHGVKSLGWWKSNLLTMAAQEA